MNADDRRYQIADLSTTIAKEGITALRRRDLPLNGPAGFALLIDLAEQVAEARTDERDRKTAAHE